MKTSVPKKPEELNFEKESTTEYLTIETNFVTKEQGIAEKREKLKGRKQDRKERKRYAKAIFIYITAWSGSILIIVILTGVKWFNFDNSVIITLITTTTANVLALFAIVAKYLFHRDSSNEKQIAQKSKGKIK